MSLFHVLYQNFFKSDCHSQIIADNIESVAKKIEFFVKKRSSKESTMEFLNDKDFKKRFPKGIKFLIIYYGNNGGDKFCRLATISGSEKEAIKLFKQRFPAFEPTKIISYEEFKTQNEPKKEKTITSSTIRLCGITATPYNSAA
jgi:hypothetical protein